MRLLTLALLGLTLAAGPAFAGKRSGPAEGMRAAPAKATMAMPGARKAAAPGKAQLALHRDAPARTGLRHAAACTARQCHAPVKAGFGWTQGLPPAAWVQANECPDGTMATLARGHEDVVRCMPI